MERGERRWERRGKEMMEERREEEMVKGEVRKGVWVGKVTLWLPWCCCLISNTHVGHLSQLETISGFNMQDQVYFFPFPLNLFYTIVCPV